MKTKSKNGYRLLNKEPSTIKLSSSKEMISEVESPRSSNSPRLLKVENVNSWWFQSAITVFSLASMSFSLVAAMQMSYKVPNQLTLCQLFTRKFTIFRLCEFIYEEIYRFSTLSVYLRGNLLFFDVACLFTRKFTVFESCLFAHCRPLPAPRCHQGAIQI